MFLTNTHIILAKKILSMMTWKRIFVIFILLITITMLIMTWTFRKEIFFKEEVINRLSTNVVMSVSPSIKNEIDDIVRKSVLINGIKIITINFQRNIRTDSYASFDNPVIQEVYNKGITSKVYETPLFSENKLSNKRLLRLISGEFICVPYKETLGYTSAPYLDGIITDVCATAIPPYQGDFSGILSIYLSAHPTKDDTERLFLLSRDISIKIYEENKYARENKK